MFEKRRPRLSGGAVTSHLASKTPERGGGASGWRLRHGLWGVGGIFTLSITRRGLTVSVQTLASLVNRYPPNLFPALTPVPSPKEKYDR